MRWTGRGQRQQRQSRQSQQKTTCPHHLRLGFILILIKGIQLNQPNDLRYAPGCKAYFMVVTAGMSSVRDGCSITAAPSVVCEVFQVEQHTKIDIIGGFFRSRDLVSHCLVGGGRK